MRIVRSICLIFSLGLLIVVCIMSVVRMRYPINQWLVFTSDRTGQFDLYLTRLDSAEIQHLAPHPQRDSHPNWSFNGGWIIFESNRNKNWDIFRIRPNGKSLKQLTSSFNIERFPYWDEDKTSVIYKRNHQFNANLLVRINADGSPSRNTNPITEYVNVALSPDGNYLAREVHGNYQVLIYLDDLTTGETTQLTTHNGRDDNLAWSADGEWLAFESNQSGNWEIYIMRRDGTDLRRITDHPSEDRDPSWSPEMSKTWHPIELVGSSLLFILGMVLFKMK